MKQTLILGNIITMDEKRPFAKAALVKNGVFAYIGSAEEAEKLTSRGTQVLDYGDNYIYPNEAVSERASMPTSCWSPRTC